MDVTTELAPMASGVPSSSRQVTLIQLVNSGDLPATKGGYFPFCSGGCLTTNCKIDGLAVKPIYSQGEDVTS